MVEASRPVSRRIFIGGAVAFGALSLVAPVQAFAVPSIEEKQAEADQMRTIVASLQAELDAKLDAVHVAQDEHDAAVAAMEAAQVRIDEATEQIGVTQGKLGVRARSMYRTGSASVLDVLLGSASFEEFITNWDILNKMNVDDATLVSTTKELRAEVEGQKKEHTKQSEIAAAKLQEAEVAAEETRVVAAQYEATLESLDAEVREMIRAEQEAAEAAAAAAAAAEQEEERRRQQAAGGGGEGGGGDSGMVSDPVVDYGPPAGDVVTEAQKYIGCPYSYGGNGPEGFDCSGFVNYVLGRCGRGIPPRSSYGYPDSGWFPVSEAQPGDVLWQPEHVGICASSGGGSYIHAGDYSTGVCWGSSPQFVRAYRY